MENIKEDPIIDTVQERFVELAEADIDGAYRFLTEMISRLDDPIKITYF